MKNNILIILTILVIMAGVNPLYSASAGGAAEWLRLGVGARAKGLGQAFVAVADDPTAAYYNPAGLSRVGQREVSFMLSKLSLDRNLNYLSYSHPFTNSSKRISVSWLGLGVDEIEERDELGHKQGDFSFPNNAFQLSYSQRIFTNFYGGLSVKYIESKYDGLTYTNKGKSDGYGIDLGLLYDINGKYSIGFSVQDISSALDWKTGTKEDIPKVYKLGSAAKFFNGRLLLSGEIDNETFSDDTKLFLGAEYWFLNKIGVRMGSRDSYFTGGLSYRQPYETFTVKLDYAFMQDTFSEEVSLAESHLFSLGVSF